MAKLSCKKINSPHPLRSESRERESNSRRRIKIRYINSASQKIKQPETVAVFCNKITNSTQFFKDNRLLSIFVGLFFAGIFCAGMYVFAATGPFAPGTVTNPQCSPTDSNCDVLSVTSDQVTSALGYTPYNPASGSLSIANGGTNSTATPTLGGVTYGTGSAYAFTGSGSSGQILQSGGSGAPAWSSATYPSTAGTSNTLLASDGTNFTNTSGLTYDGTNLQVAGVASQILSSNGSLVLGSNKNSGHDGSLNFDFESTSGAADITDGGTGTQITNLNLGTLNLSTGGYISGSPIITSQTNGVPGVSPTPVEGSMKIDYQDGRLYAYYNYAGGGDAWHYTSMNNSFQIPVEETTDPISGDQMKQGDFVVGMIDKTMSDNALHGVWVKMSSVTPQLLAQMQNNGTAGDGSVSGVDTTSFTTKITNILTSLGISIANGVTTIASLSSPKITTDTITIKQMQMVDSDTGDIYCTWIKDGEWVKVKGVCGSIDVANAQAQPSPIDQSAQQLQNAVTQVQQVVQQSQQTITQTADNAVSQVNQAAQQAQSSAQTPVETQNVAMPVTPTVLNINSVATISDINVTYGTAIASVNLPSTVNATLSDGTKQALVITWDNGTPPYDANTAGTYIFSGTLTLSSSITNTNNLKTSVNVIVAAQPVSPITAVQAAGADLFNGVLNFIKLLISKVKI